MTDFWGEMVNKLLLNQPDNVLSPWFYALADNLIQFSTLSSEEKKTNFKSQNIYKYKIDKAKKHLQGEELEYYLASFIFFESWQNKDNSKDLIAAHEDFKNQYPNSIYGEYLAASIKPIINFHSKVAESTANRNVKIIDNYEHIDSFEDLTKNLKGKRVFVDIWGTWCGPCKREFQQKNKYVGTLKANEITSLYICEGRASKEKVWKEMIKFYDLEGHHLLANKKLMTDIIGRFGNKGTFTYPRYMLIDENGNIVNAQVSSPSKTKQFEVEIKESFSI